MIYEVTSSLPRFKTLNLKPGLNIVLADKTATSQASDTRNGSGKSSLIEVLHFLLGSRPDKASVFRQPPLVDHWFAMRFDLGHDIVTVRRSGATPSKVFLTRTGGSEEIISNAEWTRRLGSKTFGIRSDSEGLSPSYRSCISYFVRRQSGGGFQTATKQHSMQRTGDVQVNLSLLLGLNVDLAAQWQTIRDRETRLSALKGAAAEGTLGVVVGDAAELASELAVAEDELATLTSAVEEFSVVPSFHKVEAEVAAYGSQIRRLTNQIVSDRDYLNQLERSLAEVRTMPAAGLEDLYAAADVQLPTMALASYREVQAFHESVIANRRGYLSAEVARVTAELESRTAERDHLAARRSEGLRLLSSGGALETLFELQRDLTQRQVRVEQLRSRYETALVLQSESGELRLQRQQLAAALARDLNERRELLRPAYVLFERLSQRLYSPDQRGKLIISATENGPDVSTSIPRGESKGITNMQVFCFDLTLAVLWSRRDAGPKFLVHDSHLFDGVDERQRLNALLAGNAASIEDGFQYVVTMNSDELPRGLPGAEALGEHVVAQRLTDRGDDGGLFGLRTGRDAKKDASRVLASA